MTGSILLNQNRIVRAGTCCIVRRWDMVNDTLETLMLQRNGSHGAGTWAVPGGWIEFGETAQAAACRELEEEVGIKISSPSHLQYVTHTEDVFTEEGKHSVTFWFHVIVPFDTIPVNREPAKITDIRWIEVRSALPCPLFLPVENLLRKELRSLL